MDLLLDKLSFPEGPRYRDGRLWFSDMHGYKVMNVDMDGHAEVVTEVAAMPSGLGWSVDGDLLIVSMRDRRLLRYADGELSTVADLSELPGFRSNDMIVDAQGRAYIGDFGFDLDAGMEVGPTVLIMVTPDGQARVAAEDLLFPNGTVITPDGKTMIIGETFAARLTAFDIDEDGGLGNRRVWAQLDGAVPDGICLDAEGCCWVASPISNQFLRVREGGDVLQRLDVDQNAIACTLGGPDGSTLFCLTAPTTDPEENQRLCSAQILCEKVDVPHAGLP